MDDSLESRPAVPGFSLAFLFAWVGVCAAFLGLTGAVAGNSGREWAMNLFITAQAMNFAAGIVGLVLCWRWWWQGREIAWQPGHWLLCVVGLLAFWYLTTWLTRLGLQNLQGPLSIGSDGVHLLSGLFNRTGKLIFLVTALVCVRLDWPWRVLPLLMVVRIAAVAMLIYSPLFLGVGPWNPIDLDALFSTGLRWVSSAAWCGALLTLTALAVRDAAQRRSRDWMHWAGVVAWAMLYVPELVAGWALWITS